MLAHPTKPKAPMDSSSHPFAVWEHGSTGRTLRTFPDIDLAAQFVINNGGEIIPNPCNW